MIRMQTAIWVIAGIYCALMLLAFVGQRALIYPATKIGGEPRVAGGRLLAIECARLGTVHAFYAPAPAGAATVVHFHGNGEELMHQEQLLQGLSARGLGVLAVEYPGYGMDRSGSANEANLYLAAECALKHLQDVLGVPSRSIVLQGQSLGTAIAVEMATRGHGAGLILISPFTSMEHMAGIVLPFLPNRFLVRDRYDSLAKASALQLPTLIVHGTQDEVIPFAMGERLSKTLTNARFIPIEGGHHNDLFLLAEDTILEAIAAFSKRFAHAP
jgi:alpha-beta hydrolase superfamily lysophospholipase